MHRDISFFIVVLDACGEVVDFLKLSHFLNRKNGYWEPVKLDKVCILTISSLLRKLYCIKLCDFVKHLVIIIENCVCEN